MPEASLALDALEYDQHLQAMKRSISQEPGYWYAYRILGMFRHIDTLLSGTPWSGFLSRLSPSTIADIGTADGDLAYFLESKGHVVDAVDCSKTRSDLGLEPVRELGRKLNSNVAVHDIDLDSQFRLPRERYDLAFFMGILYHLKNPYYALEALSKHTKLCLLSTRIARLTPSRTSIAAEPVAYLLDTRESNDDDTNY